MSNFKIGDILIGKEDEFKFGGILLKVLDINGPWYKLLYFNPTFLKDSCEQEIHSEFIDEYYELYEDNEESISEITIHN
jgi:hypothetical protein